MTFAFAPAIRERVSLVIGIAGTTGSGKTLSALKIARGLCGGDDSRIAAIDTESGRLKHYAPAPGEKPGPDRFGFMYGALHAPFTPEAYTDAIKAADEAGFEVILIDSFSHVWEGDGGLHDIHDEDTEKAVDKARSQAIERNWSFDEAAAAEKASLGAWKTPKRRHKRMVSRLLQCRAHLIICMRAEEKLRMEQVVEKRGGREYKKTVITAAKDLPLAERWVPSVEKRFPYELTLSFIVTPTEPGVPIPLKLQQQHRPAVPLDRPFSEATGEQLASWANGGTVTPIATPEQKTAERGRQVAPAPKHEHQQASPPSAEQAATPSVPTISDQQVEQIRDLLNSMDKSEPAFLKFARIKSLSDLPATDFDWACRKIKPVEAAE